MRILLVEDDAETAAFVAEGLSEAGHEIEACSAGDSGLNQARAGDHDVLIVDRMLPALDGVSLIEALRAGGVRTPILMLTAMGAVADRVEGLEAGADDYLVKPFDLAELLARVHALARRLPLRGEDAKLQVGDLVMDRILRDVRRSGDKIDLQPREFSLLELLMLNAGEIVTRSMMLEKIWKFRFDPGTNIVETHMSRLRGKIDRGGDAALIHTVRGEGYVIRAD